MNLRFIYYKVCIFITVAFITCQNYHCEDYLQIISYNRIPHFKHFSAADSINRPLQGCKDRVAGVKRLWPRSEIRTQMAKRWNTQRVRILAHESHARKSNWAFGLYFNFSHSELPPPSWQVIRALHCHPPTLPALKHRRSPPLSAPSSLLATQMPAVSGRRVLGCRIAECVRYRYLSRMSGFKPYFGQLLVTQSIKSRWKTKQ